eukprot:TRINITY_DN2919_c0_g2_i1.p1 TRINITY_DN2919_c0_g2~~TRINITY_DN2919_c0_g2_i1.p1  ORF type:complete len:740 (+),score=182.23 TRINITY_DN2919_c0_g2_i1:241-2460(+)
MSNDQKILCLSHQQYIVDHIPINQLFIDEEIFGEFCHISHNGIVSKENLRTNMNIVSKNLSLLCCNDIHLFYPFMNKFYLFSTKKIIKMLFLENKFDLFALLFLYGLTDESKKFYVAPLYTLSVFVSDDPFNVVKTLFSLNYYSVVEFILKVCPYWKDKLFTDIVSLSSLHLKNIAHEITEEYHLHNSLVFKRINDISINSTNWLTKHPIIDSIGMAGIIMSAFEKKMVVVLPDDFCPWLYVSLTNNIDEWGIITSTIQYNINSLFLITNKSSFEINWEHFETFLEVKYILIVGDELNTFEKKKEREIQHIMYFSFKKLDFISFKTIYDKKKITYLDQIHLFFNGFSIEDPIRINCVERVFDILPQLIKCFELTYLNKACGIFCNVQELFDQEFLENNASSIHISDSFFELMDLNLDMLFIIPFEIIRSEYSNCHMEKNMDNSTIENICSCCFPNTFCFVLRDQNLKILPQIDSINLNQIKSNPFHLNISQQLFKLIMAGLATSNCGISLICVAISLFGSLSNDIGVTNSLSKDVQLFLYFFHKMSDRNNIDEVNFNVTKCWKMLCWLMCAKISIEKFYNSNFCFFPKKLSNQDFIFINDLLPHVLEDNELIYSKKRSTLEFRKITPFFPFINKDCLKTFETTTEIFIMPLHFIILLNGKFMFTSLLPKYDIGGEKFLKIFVEDLNKPSLLNNPQKYNYLQYLLCQMSTVSNIKNYEKTNDELVRSILANIFFDFDHSF